MTPADNNTVKTGMDDRPETERTVGIPADRAEIDLFVAKAFSGEICRVRIDVTMTVDQAIPVIADAIGYVSWDWEKIGLYNLSRDFEYEAHARFEATRTASGDLVIMADGAACHKD